MKMLAVATAMLLLPAAAAAQPALDPKWDAWLGCWELVLENARDRSTRPSPSRRTVAPSRDASRPQVCVERAGAGAKFTTRVGTQAAIEQTVIADGTDQPFSDSDCQGTQRAEWSHDGMKLYARADLTCSGDQGKRQVSGFSILGANGTWTDIQAVDVSGQQTVRVRSYRRESEVEQIGARLVHATPLTLDDVKDASGKVSPRALEAALVETGSTFGVSGKDLIALQDAGVPGSVTDLIVALSYPERFVVERQARADRAPATAMIDDPFFLGWAFGYPMWSDMYGFYSPLYGPYSPYFYSPFAYSYLRFYDPSYWGGGFIVIDGTGGSGGPGRPSGSGRVVDGLGYTRVRPREAEATTATGSGAPLGPSSSGGGGTSSSSSGGSVSSQGFSSGGSSGSSGDSGGRTAQPR